MKRTVTVTIPATETPQNSGLDAMVEVKCEVTYVPATGFSGPPEDYDPGSFDVDVIESTINGHDHELTDDEIERMYETVEEKLSNA